MAGPSQVRQNCHWIPKARVSQTKEEVEGCMEYSITQHPDLLRTLRGLTDYHRWVSERLIPIVCKWIDEHREDVTAKLTDAEMDDMGAGVEAAYNLIEQSEWMKERLAEAETFEAERDRINLSWQAKTTAFVRAEETVKSGD